jgi:prepilin-type N-terminal cleavage/methylation domain-containing protein
MMRIWRERRWSGDEGVSLVEMLVATAIFSIILAIITTSIVSMLREQRTQTSQTNDLNSARNVITKLDHQVRYANAVSTPGTGTDGSYYVEFQSGNTNLQQTCTQWRYVPTGGTIQFRTWQPPLGGVGSSPASGWNTAGAGFSLVSLSGTPVPIWSLTQTALSQPSAQQVAQAAASTHYQLTITFKASSGSPAVTSQSQVTVTGINTTRNPASPTPPSVCTQNGRP